jgi:hypothetical protein
MNHGKTASVKATLIVSPASSAPRRVRSASSAASHGTSPHQPSANHGQATRA